MSTIATIPAKHTPHTLLGTIRWLREDPVNRRVLPLVWDADPEGLSLEQFMEWFRRKLDLKITAAMPTSHFGGCRPQRGWRKLDQDWQRAAYHTAWRVNTPRLRVYEAEVPLEFRARLAHRLTRTEDI